MTGIFGFAGGAACGSDESDLSNRSDRSDVMRRAAGLRASDFGLFAGCGTDILWAKV